MEIIEQGNNNPTSLESAYVNLTTDVIGNEPDPFEDNTYNIVPYLSYPRLPLVYLPQPHRVTTVYYRNNTRLSTVLEHP